MYTLAWRTVYALTRVLFWCLFPSLLGNSGNKHQNERINSSPLEYIHYYKYMIYKKIRKNIPLYYTKLTDQQPFKTVKWPWTTKQEETLFIHGTKHHIQENQL